MEMTNDDFQFSNILSKTIWIHKNRFKDSNAAFISFLEKRKLKFTEAFEVASGIEEIKKVHFQCIYIIISGSMFNDFVNLLKQNLNEILCLSVITIFTLHRKECERFEYANHPFFNPGGICTKYSEIINTFIKFDSLVKIKIEKNHISPKFDDQCFNFEEIDSIPKLYFPFIYSKLIEEIDDVKIYEFNKNILKYDNKDINSLIYPLTFLKKIPIEILAKFWLRIYTLETDFYNNINCKLMKLQGEEYYTYIKLMYLALNKKIVKNRCDICLYRGDFLNDNELNIIINKVKSNSIKDKLIYTRRFLSFSSSKEIAKRFIKNKYQIYNNSINYALFLIEPFSGNIEDSKCYNIEMDLYSNYNEKEYLFLPYSPFFLNNIEKKSLYINENTTIIINIISLLYIGTHLNLIDESMKNIASLDNLSFEFLEKNFLDVIRQYKVFENENNIWEKIKLILKQNLQNHN